MPLEVETGDANGAELRVRALLVQTPDAGAPTPELVGGVRLFSEVDSGTKTGVALLLSPETSQDYRQRTEAEAMLDQETFIYAAQNTAKHIYRNTTMTITWSANGLLTNATGITTTNTGVSFATYEVFPIANAQAIYCEIRGALSALVGVTNTTIDFGLFIPTTGATPWAPTDGAYFRVTSAGMQGISFASGAGEVSTGVFAGFTWAANTVYKYVVEITVNAIRFWINDVLYGVIPVAAGQASPCLAGALPFAVRHAIAGAASGVMQFKVGNYAVSCGGYVNTPSIQDARGAAGQMAHQGQSGGTMGSQSNITNSQAFTSAVLSNTATIVTGLGGRFGITIGASANTDGICTSYQNPVNSVSFTGRTLKVRGVTISAVVQTVLGATALILDWYAAFGHTALSLATAEAATTKAPRRVPLGIHSWIASAAVGAQANVIQCRFEEPLCIEPGEFFQIVAQQPLGVTGTIFCVVSVDAGLV